MTKKTLSTFLLFTVLGFSIPVIPAKAETVTINITNITCKEMLLMGGEERESTLIFFHGIMMGKMDTTVVNSKKVTNQTDTILNYCISNPQDKLMSAFSKAYR